mmetsp:Transcript_25515/g.101687  ORF Transcript_25515/g.101687 Transcript_25515/m.101687 type:complete len:721 (+) Transcript_25515:81-2243(+)
MAIAGSCCGPSGLTSMVLESISRHANDGHLVFPQTNGEQIWLDHSVSSTHLVDADAIFLCIPGEPGTYGTLAAIHGVLMAVRARVYAESPRRARIVLVSDITSRRYTSCAHVQCVQNTEVEVTGLRQESSGYGVNLLIERQLMHLAGLRYDICVVHIGALRGLGKEVLYKLLCNAWNRSACSSAVCSSMPTVHPMALSAFFDWLMSQHSLPKKYLALAEGSTGGVDVWFSKDAIAEFRSSGTATAIVKKRDHCISSKQVASVVNSCSMSQSTQVACLPRVRKAMASVMWATEASTCAVLYGNCGYVPSIRRTTMCSSMSSSNFDLLGVRGLLARCIWIVRPNTISCLRVGAEALAHEFDVPILEALRAVQWTLHTVLQQPESFLRSCHVRHIHSDISNGGNPIDFEPSWNRVHRCHRTAARHLCRGLLSVAVPGSSVRLNSLPDGLLISALKVHLLSQRSSTCGFVLLGCPCLLPAYCNSPGAAGSARKRFTGNMTALPAIALVTSDTAERRGAYHPCTSQGPHLKDVATLLMPEFSSLSICDAVVVSRDRSSLQAQGSVLHANLGLSSSIVPYAWLADVASNVFAEDIKVPDDVIEDIKVPDDVIDSSAWTDETATDRTGVLIPSNNLRKPFETNNFKPVPDLECTNFGLHQFLMKTMSGPVTKAMLALTGSDSMDERIAHFTDLLDREVAHMEARTRASAYLHFLGSSARLIWSQVAR